MGPGGSEASENRGGGKPATPPGLVLPLAPPLPFDPSTRRSHTRTPRRHAAMQHTRA